MLPKINSYSAQYVLCIVYLYNIALYNLRWLAAVGGVHLSWFHNPEAVIPLTNS